MQGNEQIGLVLASQRDALGKRQERIGVPRQRHVEPAGFHQQALELEREGEDDVFLLQPIRRPCAPIHAAMAGIDDHQWPHLAGRRCRLTGRGLPSVQSRRRRCRLSVCIVGVITARVRREVLRRIGHEIDHQPRRLILEGIKNIGLLHLRRPRESERNPHSIGSRRFNGVARDQSVPGRLIGIPCTARLPAQFDNDTHGIDGGMNG